MLTKRELVFKVKQEMRVTTREAERFINAYYTVIKHALIEGENVSFGDIGTLKCLTVTDRKCVNPQTGQSMTIPAHRVVRLRMSKILKEKLK